MKVKETKEQESSRCYYYLLFDTVIAKHLESTNYLRTEFFFYGFVDHKK